MFRDIERKGERKMELDSESVRVINDIFDAEDNLLVEGGTEFVWSDESDHQYIPGVGSVSIGDDEVELAL
jgi:hypothetical protein